MSSRSEPSSEESNPLGVATKSWVTWDRRWCAGKVEVNYLQRNRFLATYGIPTVADIGVIGSIIGCMGD